jgi:predicted metalloprotease
MRWRRGGSTEDVIDVRRGSGGARRGGAALPVGGGVGIVGVIISSSSRSSCWAAAVGDDRLQSQAGRRINPDSFTHGSSAQRHAWFERGRARGEPADCDTFSADEL